MRPHFVGRCLAALATIVLLIASSEARANCADVNAGVFNRTAFTPAGSGILNTSSGFAVGDTVTFTVSGLTGSSFELINGALNTALLTQALSAGSATISYTVTGNNSDTTLNTYMLVQAIPFEITIVATCAAASSGSTGDSSGRSSAVVRAFMASRINGILLNDPSGTSLLNRSGVTGTPQSSASGANVIARGGAGSSSNAMGLGASGTLRPAFGIADDDAADIAGSTNVHFSHSLSQIRRQAVQANSEWMALGAGTPASAPRFPLVASPWDIWIEGRYSAFDAKFDRNGRVGVLSVGADYRFSKDMLAGILAQFDWAQDNSGVISSKVAGNGWMIGPYLSARVHDKIFLDLRAAWGLSSNALSIGTATGDFETRRWLLKGTLSGMWMNGPWRFTPGMDLAYVTETSEAFTNSAGTSIPGQQVSLGRVQFGPEVGFRIAQTPSAFVEPFVAVKWAWNFHNPIGSNIDGTVVGPGAFWTRLQGGLNIATASGLHVRGQASWDGLGVEGYNGYTLQGSVRIPLN